MNSFSINIQDDFIFDKHSVSDDFVFDKHSGELVGLIDLGADLNDIFRKNSCFDGKVPMICGIASSLKFSLGYFATCNATCGMLYPLMG